MPRREISKKEIMRIRLKISKIDKEIIRLIAERMKLAKSIGLIKKRNRKVIEDKTREKKILESVMRHASGLGLNTKHIAKIWKIIMYESRTIQR